MTRHGPKSPTSGAGRTFHTPAGFRDSPEPAVANGEVISSTYRAERELARMDNGAVVEAWDMLVERPVVLKVAWRDPGTPSLVAEARRCAAVSGGAGAAVHCIGHHRGVEYLAGERVAGVSLRERLDAALAAGEPFDGGEALEVVMAAARALVQVHQAGLTAGELDPATVLLAGQRTVLGRFALGQVASGPPHGGRAPEIVTGQHAAGDASGAVAVDLYELGCLAVELITGAPPYQADTPKAVLFGHVHHRPPVVSEGRSDVPVELGDLICELLAKDPAARPTTAVAVLDQLEVIAERVRAGRSTIRVLIVDDDGDRVRDLWSAVRRAHPRTQVDAARDGREAATRLARDRPDLVLIDSGLGRVVPGMNALELIMFSHGLDEMNGAVVAVLGDSLGERDSAMLTRFGARVAGPRTRVADLVARLIDEAAIRPRTTGPRRSVSG